MAKEKACLHCKVIFEGLKCPICKETLTTETIKGRIHIFNPEDSEIAKKMKIKQKGEYAIRTK